MMQAGVLQVKNLPVFTAVPSGPRVEPIGDDRGHFSLSSHSFKAKALGQAEYAWSMIRMCTGIGLEVFGASGLGIAKTHLANGRQVGG